MVIAPQNRTTVNSGCYAALYQRFQIPSNRFLGNLKDERGMNMSHRHVSVSTCGLVPKILELAKEKLQITLSVSLHAPDNETRNKIMPVNKSYDVEKLLAVLQRIVNHGDTVLVIEHNLDVIKSADYIIDLGPEGGDDGGTVVARGTVEQVAKVENSYTGQYLKKILEGSR